MFVIIGANGNTGRVAAETLINARQPVRVVLRDDRARAAWEAKGAQVVTGDLDDPASLVRAFAGARGVYLLLPPDHATDDALGRARRLFGNAAAAIAQAQVPHVVFLSAIGAQHPDGNGPIAGLHLGEQLLGALPGVARTFVRAAYFVENHAAVLGIARAQGVLPTFLPPDAKIPQVATGDVGRAVARALVEPPPAGATRIVNLAGPADVSEREVAGVVGAILGKPVEVASQPLDAVVPTFTGFGCSIHVAELFRGLYAGIASGRIAWPAGEQVVRGTDDARAVLAQLMASPVLASLAA